MDFTYLAYTDTYVKIGRTKNPKKRKRELLSGCPLDLTIVFLVETPTLNEPILHERFAKHRLHHEWFALSHEIKDFIFSMSNRGWIDGQRIKLKRPEKYPEPVRIIKTSRVVDMLDTGESIKLED